MPNIHQLNRMANLGDLLTGKQSLGSFFSRTADSFEFEKAQRSSDISPLVSTLTDFGEKLIGAFDSYSSAMSTSAMSAQKELIASQNQFNKEEAEAARTFAQSSANKAMAFEKEEAKIARDWSKMMSDTAYQRAMADMKAAGLNPVLAFGSPAGSGQVSYASGKTAASSAASASTSLDPSRGKEADTSMPALIAGLLGSAAKIMAAFAK